MGLISNTAFAASQNTEEIINNLKTDSSNYGKIVKVEDGLYIITMPISVSSSEPQTKSPLSAKGYNTETFAGVLQIKLYQDDTISNLFSVSYIITADSYFNGVKGNFTIKSTSVLKPKTYLSKSMDSNFPSTMLYQYNMGSVILPPEDSSVRLKATGVKVYSLTMSSWVPGLTFNKVFKY